MHIFKQDFALRYNDLKASPTSFYPYTPVVEGLGGCILWLVV